MSDIKNVGWFATGKREYKDYPTKYYGVTPFGMVVNVSRETYEKIDKETAIEITWYNGNIYYKEKTEKGEK